MRLFILFGALIFSSIILSSCASKPAKYVFKVQSGFIEKHDVKAGDIVRV